MDIIKTKREIIDLASQKQVHLDAAAAALDAKDEGTYKSEMEKVRNISQELLDRKALVTEAEAAILAQPEDPKESRDKAEERANALRSGGEISFSATEIRRAFKNADGDGTIVSGTIAQPTGAGTEVRDNRGASVLPELVQVQDMSGLGGWEEPYVIADMATAVGVPASVGGTARTKHDPSLGIAQIKPYEVSVTSLVDKNIGRLSPTAYMAKIQQMAMRALRNKIASLILLGDAEATHVMYGMINGTNKAGSSIISTVAATVASSKGKIDEQLLNSLYFAYGNNYEVGGNAMLFCNKTDLKAWGALRGTNEKGRLFSFTPEAGQANRGILSDGGLIVPYLLDPTLTAVDGTSQPASSGADKLCCIYGDPTNYLLGLFGDYTIRVDESVKSIERMYAILGDVVVGGNVVAHDGFVVAKIPKAAG